MTTKSTFLGQNVPPSSASAHDRPMVRVRSCQCPSLGVKLGRKSQSSGGCRSTEVFAGIDVAKVRNAVAIADGERGGEVRYLGEVASSEESMRRLVKRIAAKHDRVHFCYEAGPTGYGLYRLITALGHPCAVVAPSLIPRKPGDRVRTNRRDAVALANLQGLQNGMR